MITISHKQSDVSLLEETVVFLFGFLGFVGVGVLLWKILTYAFYH